MKIAWKSAPALGILALACLLALAAPACKGQGGSQETISLDSFAAVMGKPALENSGIADLVRNDQGLKVVYHLYIPESSDFETVVGKDLAPKIEKLYQTFKSLDMVTFDVQTPDAANPGNFRPYCAFEMTRKIYKQLNWTNLLARDLFKVCKVVYPK